jgi:hypothetical protein
MIALSLRSPAMRPVLLADAAITGTTALLMLAGAKPLADLLDLPVALLAGAGAVLVPYVGYLLWLANRNVMPRAGIAVTIAANLAWAIGCGVLLIGGSLEPNGPGIAFILLNAVAVIVFADLQLLALRGERPEQAQTGLPIEIGS